MLTPRIAFFGRYVLEHLSRLSRVLRIPGGNALLVGVGGSGRQSLTRLAAFMSGVTVFQPEISKGYGKIEWREDIKVRVIHSKRLKQLHGTSKSMPQNDQVSSRGHCGNAAGQTVKGKETK